MQGLVDKYGQPLPKAQTGPRTSRPFAPWWGLFSQQRLPRWDNLQIKDYARIIDTDETVAAGLEFCQLTVLEHLGEYSNTNKRAKAYIDELWSHCRVSLEEAVTDMLSALWAGWSVGELVMEAYDGKIWLDDFPFLDPAFSWFKVETDRGNRNYGRPIGVCQEPSLVGPFIPADKLAVYTHRGRFGNPYGVSRLKPIFKNWVIKDVLLQSWGQALERFGTPLPVAKTRNGRSPTMGANGQPSTISKDLQTVLDDMSVLQSIVLEMDEQDISFVGGPKQMGDLFERNQNHMNKVILRGLLVPALLMEPTDIGSFALGNKHFEMFMRGVMSLVKAVRRVLLFQVYRPLLILNFGPNVEIGEFKGQILDESGLQIWAQIFFSLANTGFVDARVQGDFDAVRARFNLSTRTAPLELPTAPAQPADPSGMPAPSNGQTPHPRSQPKTPKTGPQGRPKTKNSRLRQMIREEFAAALLSVGTNGRSHAASF